MNQTVQIIKYLIKWLSKYTISEDYIYEVILAKFNVDLKDLLSH